MSKSPSCKTNYWTPFRNYSQTRLDMYFTLTFLFMIELLRVSTHYLYSLPGLYKSVFNHSGIFLSYPFYTELVVGDVCRFWVDIRVTKLYKIVLQSSS